jgi:hypothetical protein
VTIEEQPHFAVNVMLHGGRALHEVYRERGEAAKAFRQHIIRHPALRYIDAWDVDPAHNAATKLWDFTP